MKYLCILLISLAFLSLVHSAAIKNTLEGQRSNSINQLRVKTCGNTKTWTRYRNPIIREAMRRKQLKCLGKRFQRQRRWRNPAQSRKVLRKLTVSIKLRRANMERLASLIRTRLNQYKNSNFLILRFEIEKNKYTAQKIKRRLVRRKTASGTIRRNLRNRLRRLAVNRLHTIRKLRIVRKANHKRQGRARGIFKRKPQRLRWIKIRPTRRLLNWMIRRRNFLNYRIRSFMFRRLRVNRRFDRVIRYLIGRRNALNRSIVIARRVGKRSTIRSAKKSHHKRVFRRVIRKLSRHLVRSRKSLRRHTAKIVRNSSTKVTSLSAQRVKFSVLAGKTKQLRRIIRKARKASKTVNFRTFRWYPKRLIRAVNRTLRNRRTRNRVVRRRPIRRLSIRLRRVRFNRKLYNHKRRKSILRRIGRVSRRMESNLMKRTFISKYRRISLIIRRLQAYKRSLLRRWTRILGRRNHFRRVIRRKINRRLKIYTKYGMRYIKLHNAKSRRSLKIRRVFGRRFRRNIRRLTKVHKTKGRAVLRLKNGKRARRIFRRYGNKIRKQLSRRVGKTPFCSYLLRKHLEFLRLKHHRFALAYLSLYDVCQRRSLVHN